MAEGSSETRFRVQSSNTDDGGDDDDVNDKFT